MKGSFSTVVSTVNLGSSLEEMFSQGRVASSGGNNQWSVATWLGGIDIGTMSKKKVTDINLVLQHSLKKRRVSVCCLSVDTSVMLQEEVRNWNMTRLRSGDCCRTDNQRSRMELEAGIEPATSSLPRRCSTTELLQPPCGCPVGANRRRVPDGMPGPAGSPRSGAGDGNRTHVICLEGRGSTIELRPRFWTDRAPNSDDPWDRRAWEAGW